MTRTDRLLVLVVLSVNLSVGIVLTRRAHLERLVLRPSPVASVAPTGSR